MSQDFHCSVLGWDSDTDDAGVFITAESPSAAARLYAERIDFAAYGRGKKQPDTRRVKIAGRTVTRPHGVGACYAVTVVVQSSAGAWEVEVVGAPVRWDYGVRRCREVSWQQ